MEQVTIIGIDISKRSFQLHGATAEGKPVFGKKLSRQKFLVFLSEAPPCLVVMEACGGAHYWGSTDHRSWPDVQADPADLCQAIPETAEE